MFDEGESFEWYLEQCNIRIYKVDKLTTKIRGFCYYDIEEYHILINSKLDFFGQRKTMIHELIHIFENHFSCEEKDRERCEKEVKTIIKNFKNMYNEEYSYDLV